MAAGSLNKRITIQQAHVTFSETNEAIENWVTVATRWGEIKALTGNEAVKAKALQAEVTHQITMREGFDIFPDYRFVHGAQIYNLLSVIPKDEWLLILAVEVVGESYNCASLTALATLTATAV